MVVDREDMLLLCGVDNIALDASVDAGDGTDILSTTFLGGKVDALAISVFTSSSSSQSKSSESSKRLMVPPTGWTAFAL